MTEKVEKKNLASLTIEFQTTISNVTEGVIKLPREMINESLVEGWKREGLLKVVCWALILLLLLLFYLYYIKRNSKYSFFVFLQTENYSRLIFEGHLAKYI